MKLSFSLPIIAPRQNDYLTYWELFTYNILVSLYILISHCRVGSINQYFNTRTFLYPVKKSINNGYQEVLKKK